MPASMQIKRQTLNKPKPAGASSRPAGTWADAHAAASASSSSSSMPAQQQRAAPPPPKPPAPAAPASADAYDDFMSSMSGLL